MGKTIVVDCDGDGLTKNCSLEFSPPLDVATVSKDRCKKNPMPLLILQKRQGCAFEKQNPSSTLVRTSSPVDGDNCSGGREACAEESEKTREREGCQPQVQQPQRAVVCACENEGRLGGMTRNG